MSFGKVALFVVIPCSALNILLDPDLISSPLITEIRCTPYFLLPLPSTFGDYTKIG